MLRKIFTCFTFSITRRNIFSASINNLYDRGMERFIDKSIMKHNAEAVEYSADFPNLQSSGGNILSKQIKSDACDECVLRSCGCLARSALYLLKQVKIREFYSECQQ